MSAETNAKLSAETSAKARSATGAATFALPESRSRGERRQGWRGSFGVRAVAVAAGWALALVPSALGSQRCPFATIFHLPCPGCGMTRAVRLLQAGDASASLQMNPFAVPVVATMALLALSTVLTTLLTGTPVAFYKTLLGRASLASVAIVYFGATAFWVLRWFGLFGGPVPVG
jgi:hypothetical protein